LCGGVRWAFFTNLFFEALALEAVSVVVGVVKKLFVQSSNVQGCTVANRVAHNEEGIKEVNFFWG